MDAHAGPADSLPAYGEPSKFEKDVIRRTRETRATDTEAFSVTPLQNLHGIITPNGLVFERHHAGVPEIPPDQHRLVVHGLVEQPLVFTMDDLLRFPSVSRIHFLECAGNSSTEWRTSGYHSVQRTHGLLSCCEWTGVPLSAILDEVGLKPEAKWILAEGADAAGMTRSVPVAKALDDALIVYAQNGEMLRPEQGYPVRLFLPGFEGNMSVKWLRRLKVGDTPWHMREETSRYTNLLSSGKAYQFAFEMDVKSVVTFPNSGRSFKGKGATNLGHRLVGARPYHARRCVGRRRRDMAARRAARARAHQMPDAIPPALCLGRPAARDPEQGL